MQTFIPYPDFEKSLKALDRSRLQKQAIETSQLIDTLLNLPTKSGNERKGWHNHPALIMWKNNVGSLFQYFLCNIDECKNRNIKTTYCESKVLIYEQLCYDFEKPKWFGDDCVHSSHRARLLQKGYEELFKGQKNAHKTIQWYKDFDWSEMQNPELFYQEYKWPTNITEHFYDLKECVSVNALKNKQLLINAYGLNPFMD